MRYSIEDIKYNGKYHKEFWEKDYNPNADLENGLANCTTFVIGACLVEKNPYPVSRISSASNWDNYLINDWKKISFDPSRVKAGDILQWKTKGHVCKVADIRDGIIYINGSYYTGEHGVSIYNGTWDSRNFSSLKELSDFMSTNYPDRFYHCWSLDKENQIVGSEPDFIFVLPNTISNVPRDSSKDQIECTDNTLRIRNKPSLDGEIIGHVSVGYYDVLNIKEATQEDKEKEPDLKCWYEISKNRWIANITTIYLEKSDDDIIRELEKYFDSLKKNIKDLTNENKELKSDMEEIRKITGKWL